MGKTFTGLHYIDLYTFFCNFLKNQGNFSRLFINRMQPEEHNIMANTKNITLSPRHQQIARLLVGGYTQTKISKTMGLHKSTVSRLIRRPEVASEVKRLQEMADVNATTSVPGMPDKISEGAYKSIQVLMEILEDERTDPAMMKIKAVVAQDLLSRAGYGPIKQIDVRQEQVSSYFTREDLDELFRRAKAEEQLEKEEYSEIESLQ